MMNAPASSRLDSRREKFEQLLAQERFTGLKAVLESISRDRETLFQAVNSADSYEELMGKLGFRLGLVKQIHVQDAFSRVGQAGGIRSVLPYYDIPTQSSLPTLINLDSTATTTPKGAIFFNQILAELKAQMSPSAARMA